MAKKHRKRKRKRKKEFSSRISKDGGIWIRIRQEKVKGVEVWQQFGECMEGR